MELQFEKNTRSCLQQVLWDTQSMELTQELRLPEGMPDIGQVIACWAQPVIRGKEWRSDRVSVSGGVMCWVLYTPEEEGMPQGIAAWLPYQLKWDIPQTRHDGTIIAQPFMRGADARSLSSRKLMLRANMGMQVQAVTPGEITLHVPGELPNDVQLLKKTYPMLLPAEAGEKAFQIEEDIAFPSSLPQPEQIVRYDLRPELAEWKMMTDKAVFRGTAYLHMLYRSADGQLHTWDHEIPISQYADLDKEYDTEAMVDVLPAVTNLELDLIEGQLRLKAGLTGQYMVYERPMIELIEDAYSPVRQVTANREEVSLPAVLDTMIDTVKVEQTIETDAGSVIDLAFYPDSPQQLYGGETVESHLPGVFQLLCRNGEGNLESVNAYWEETTNLPVSENARVQTRLLPTGTPQAMLGGGGVSMQADLMTQNQVLGGQGISAITGLALGEETAPDPNRPSLILRRAGQERLWDIAKATATTVEHIRQANHLADEPDENQMLIIPIP